ncbi:MAG: mechanosensitive ion channel domain-containing protein [Pirellulales bacterium]
MTREAWRELVLRIWLFMPKLAAGLLVLLLFWLAASLLARFIHRVGTRARVNSDVLSLMSWTAKITVFTFGAVTACATLGIDVGALVAGLGLTGFAIGFAVKDIISNLLAGILILVYEPFRRGDHVAVAGLEGTVTAIDFRYTTLKLEDKLVLVPNANLFTKEIVVKRL